ncbi:hypothetical protein PHISCL_03539 [Aspergillus sclerotialis]|uniref:Uncharacterized protein n=1 Tax=Aspergillus sclerotialis TaxID=2070753 RepID=A0A3A2ZXQ6_9EURO|nr:hypothetical protein PHISCL_03539 [Aspergillus sclerotialis]
MSEVELVLVDEALWVRKGNAKPLNLNRPIHHRLCPCPFSSSASHRGRLENYRGEAQVLTELEAEREAVQNERLELRHRFNEEMAVNTEAAKALDEKIALVHRIIDSLSDL